MYIYTFIHTIVGRLQCFIVYTRNEWVGPVALAKVMRYFPHGLNLRSVAGYKYVCARVCVYVYVCVCVRVYEHECMRMRMCMCVCVPASLF